MDSKVKKRLRSQDWFGKQDKDGFIHRSWLKNQGYPDDMFDGRPVIGICNTWSELTPCNGHFRELAEFVKRGVYEAGGFPLEFPVMSLGETQLKPTAMLFRNLASMDVEESIRGNPMDGVVLLMGCDKTTPSLLMGAASCDLPTIGVSGGPMLTGPLPRQADRIRHRRVADVRRRARRAHVAGGIHRRRIVHASLQGPLHDHGHRLDDGQHGRSARRLTTRQRGDPRGRRAALSPRATLRPAHRRDGARRSGAVEDPHAQGVRERHHGERGDRRFHQLGGAPAGDRRTHWA